MPPLCHCAWMVLVFSMWPLSLDVTKVKTRLIALICPHLSVYGSLIRSVFFLYKHSASRLYYVSVFNDIWLKFKPLHDVDFQPGFTKLAVIQPLIVCIENLLKDLLLIHIYAEWCTVNLYNYIYFKTYFKKTQLTGWLLKILEQKDNFFMMLERQEDHKIIKYYY